MNPRASAFVAFTDSATAGHAAIKASSAPPSPESAVRLRLSQRGAQQHSQRKVQQHSQLRARAHPLTLFISNLRAAISD
jgi:hypothetical protein